MKKILLSAAVICLSTTAFSQNKGSTKLGVQFGSNLSAIIINLYNISDARVCFNAGISADHYFSESWSFKIKALYDQKGWRNGLSVNNVGESPSNNFNLDYLTIPVLANWHFGGTKNWFLSFGPYTGFLLNAKEKSQNINFINAFNGLDIGIDTCIGVQFPVSARNKLFIEFDTESGMTGVLKNHIGPAAKNYATSLNVGFNF